MLIKCTDLEICPMSLVKLGAKSYLDRAESDEIFGELFFGILLILMKTLVSYLTTLTIILVFFTK